jgi:acetyl/propionyl-CoA carboxylase alpha subunit
VVCTCTRGRKRAKGLEPSTFSLGISNLSLILVFQGRFRYNFGKLFTTNFARYHKNPWRVATADTNSTPTRPTVVLNGNRKRRIPKLKFTESRGIGWHVSYRDPVTGLPRKHRFKVATKAEAEKAYHSWMVTFLGDDQQPKDSPATATAKISPQQKKELLAKAAGKVTKAKAQAGSLLHIGSGLIAYEEGRVRKDGEGRVSGSIAPRVAKADLARAVQRKTQFETDPEQHTYKEQ